MSMHLRDLDSPGIRALMLDEVEHDARNDALYLSPRLSEVGRAVYPEALREAIASGSDEMLADSLRREGIIRDEERRETKHGPVMAQIPITAAATLAEGEMNRFYIRGVCRKAIADGIPQVVVYRAKEVEQPRVDSQAKVGVQVPAADLLADLRRNIGVDTAFGLPRGPNSGLSVRLP
jgi:hypothetical protein